LGLFKRFTPKFVKVYANMYDQQVKSVKEFIDDVHGGSFPTDDHSFSMKADAVEELKKLVD
ncbi:MAG: 3-methyl-2-oxobutanoate hydroxymethyltransferase, partial [bacterium]